MMKSFVLSTPIFIAAVQAQDQFPYLQSAEFDAGTYGAYPNRTYISEPHLTSPRLNILQTDPRCDDGLYTMISLRGDRVDVKGQSPMIHDAKGNLVWMNASYGETFGLAVQTYKGQDYLTFWQGDDSVGGHGEGVFIILDSSYREAFRLTAGEGKLGDLREFYITKTGTALLTQYLLTPARFGNRQGNILDSIIQEVDISTNKILFEWRASDHFSIDDFSFPVGASGRTKGSGYDFFYINSIDKDELGNYLISSCYFSSVTYISGSTGEILWVLGGKKNSFKDMSNGKATNFQFQHDVRWNNDHTGITLFDNSARYGLEPHVDYSRGLHISLDLGAMEASVRREYINPNHIISASQGSMQILPSGNVLIGYGYNAAWTEYLESGEPICDVHIGSQKAFNTGAVQTYRVNKHAWTGKPIESPKIEWKDGAVWLSWNGATEVSHWVVQGGTKEAMGATTSVEKAMVSVQMLEKRGFETHVKFECQRWAYVRGVAVDGKGTRLGVSEAVEVVCEGTGAAIQQAIQERRMQRIRGMLEVLALMASWIGMYNLWKWAAKRRVYSRLYQKVSGEAIFA